MKLKSFTLFIFLFFIGTICCNALPKRTEDLSGNPQKALYYDYEYCYRVLGALTYYDDYSVTSTDLDGIWQSAIEINKPFYKYVDEDKTATATIPYDEIRNTLIEIYNQKASSMSELARAVVNSLKAKDFFSNSSAIEGNYLNILASKTNFTDMLTYTQSCMKNLNFGESGYEDLIETTGKSYESFCDYLNDYKGIAYYIKTALKIVGYVALGLAVILGGIDFAEAILSNEDNALTKAFQKFIRRLIAAILVFLAYLIVQIFLGLVTKIPGVDDSQIKICNQLKIGSL